MIRFVNGDMFDTKYDAYINPVNCKGVMGAGLALDFKYKYPINFEAYKVVCNSGALKPGGIYYTVQDHTVIINFATKDHWKDPSRIEWIEEGCRKLRDFWLSDQNIIESVAIPKLGCGLGGLKWSDVRPILIKYFNDITNVDIYIYE